MPPFPARRPQPNPSPPLQVLSMYIEQILPAICQAGEDRHYGSCASADIIALQAISKRVHYGKQV